MKVRNSLFGGFILAGFLVATPAAATADSEQPPTASIIPCSTGTFCAWEHTNFGGLRWGWSNGNDEDDWATNGASNRTSSWQNLASLSVQVYDTHGFRDPLFCLGTTGKIPSDSRYNDKPNSHLFFTRCP